ncbi:MAG: hypothetical protein CO186_09085 [Zetaproteobacteria bacterium CG_4_9_14_3_um_filter_49_83]|nr:MAG: hypothetical protein COZ00_05080 [Zetaproteobacteria bacterium CG_4_10_14_0_8_um_filter_49_80]PJA34822.1 MAG: hypothetical protein CO186_09085 [Zetaproteobacteria bacterium CG_4_9_14_3_um_filter_49_83]
MRCDVVTVLINYNGLDDTLACLHSLRESDTLPFVVLVDNGSAIGNRVDVDVAKEIYPNIHVIQSEENLGFGGGNNLGINWALENTVCKYVYVLNNDTILRQNSISILTQYMESHIEVGACSPRIMSLDYPDIVWYGGGYLNWKKGGARSPMINKTFDDCMDNLDVTFISGCAMFLRREALEKTKGFDERFFIYCEDVDLSARIIKAGYKISYVPSSLLLHKAHSSLRGDEGKHFFTHSITNPRLTFFLEHLVYGSLLNLSLHATFVERIQGQISLLIRWSKWSVSYVLNRRIDAFRAMWRGLVRFHKQKKLSRL